LRTGWPSDALPRLKRQTARIVNNSRICEFYIGRTTDVESTQYRHGCDRIIPIYETSSADHAIHVEGGLIHSFIYHPKCSNNSPHSGGGVSDRYINYVYVAVWYY